MPLVHNRKRRRRNPFYQIRQAMGLPVTQLPEIPPATVSALELGQRRVVTRTTLERYVALAGGCASPVELLHSYQELYGYPQTPVQDYAGRVQRRVGDCTYCVRRDVELIAHSLFFEHPMCTQCYPREYSRLPHVVEARREQQAQWGREMNGILGECGVCRLRGGSVTCAECGIVVCRWDRFVIDEPRSGSDTLRYRCRECAGR